jgi:hypothetical protein
MATASPVFQHDFAGHKAQANGLIRSGDDPAKPTLRNSGRKPDL